MKKKEIASRLRKFGEEHFVTMKRFADELGMTQQALSTGYLSGRSELKAEMIMKLKDLGCDINWLLSGEATHPPAPSREGDRNENLEYEEMDRIGRLQADMELIKSRLSDPRIVRTSNGVVSMEFDIVGMVPAGRGEFKESIDRNVFTLQLDPNNEFAIAIDPEYGWSMKPFIDDGDVVVCSWSERWADGDIVIARWDETKGAFKIIYADEHDKNQIFLYSYNMSEKPISVKRNKLFAYKVKYVAKGALRPTIK